MTTPPEHEINVHDSLDEIVARDHFLNKSVQEGEVLFRENSTLYQEDLMWMGPRAFAYYLQSAVNYVKSDDASDDHEFVSYLHDIIEFRRNQEEFVLAKEDVMDLITYVIGHFDKFNADEGADAALLAKYEQLKNNVV